MATSPDGKNVYVAALSYSAIDVFGPALGGISRHTLTVAKAGTGSGNVTSSPTGIECGPTCSHTYPDGTKVTLSAVPDSSTTFTGWSGSGCVGTGSCELTIAEDMTVTATFQPAPPKKSPPFHGIPKVEARRPRFRLRRTRLRRQNR